MNSLLASLARMPRPLWFALAGLVQLALIAMMVIDRASVLREGTEVLLQTRPVDPRDFLRGDYVVLSYDISE
ncbi:MAG TPA: GDYXXLXY domain-containing protein, partial [Xanthobacteraceae bacterium]